MGSPLTEPIRKNLSAWLDPANLNYTRALTLMVLGAIVGLVLAAIGLFTAKGTSTLVVPPEDVALVNQQPIVRSDYLAQLRALYDIDLPHATPEQRKKVLDDMIREELFVQRGTELDVAAADPAVRTDMVSAVEQQSATDAMTQLPNDDKLLAYYQAHKDRYSTEGYMHLRDLVFPRSASDAVLSQKCAFRNTGSSRAAVSRTMSSTSDILIQNVGLIRSRCGSPTMRIMPDSNKTTNADQTQGR